MSVIIKWQFDINVDDLPHEGCKEFFVSGSPGKIPFSFKLPNSVAKDEAQVEAHIEKVKQVIKKMFIEAVAKELQSI